MSWGCAQSLHYVSLVFLRMAMWHLVSSYALLAHRHFLESALSSRIRWSLNDPKSVPVGATCYFDIGLAVSMAQLRRDSFLPCFMSTHGIAGGQSVLRSPSACANSCALPDQLCGRCLTLGVCTFRFLDHSGTGSQEQREAARSSLEQPGAARSSQG